VEMLHLKGRLDHRLLRDSIRALIAAQNALRIRICVRDGVPLQAVDDAVDFELVAKDLTSLSDRERAATIERCLERLILGPWPQSGGALFGINLLAIGHDEHVLIVAIDHMISDAASMGIFLRDLFAGYSAGVRAGHPTVPSPEVQFLQFAAHQRRGLTHWLDEHGSYWNKRLAGCRRVGFPKGEGPVQPEKVGWSYVSLRLDPECTQRLRRWAKVHRTTLAMSVFTAYVALVMRYCDVSDMVVQYQSNGRLLSGVENTIGFFATVLLLRVELRESDSFVDLLTRLTQEYCHADEHADHSWLEAQSPRPDFAYNTAFNWVPASSSLAPRVPDSASSELEVVSVPFDHPVLRQLRKDAEPSILLYEKDQEVTGGVYFPVSRHSRRAMALLAQNFVRFVESLLSQPDALVPRLPLMDG
jgi:hypothetical protein